MILTHKEVFARLLANENIDVQHGNYKTAFFDIKTRTLGLPAWNNEETYDMLVGHEVSHALYTPLEEWISYVKENPKFQDLVNIVEDVRIERLILRRYPGLVKDFRRGYKHIMDMDFFSVGKKRDFSVFDMGFLDRINLKAKARDLVTVEFTPEEQVLFDRCYTTETFAEVIQLSKDIVAHLGKKFDEAEKSMQDVMMDNGISQEKDGMDRKEGEEDAAAGEGNGEGEGDTSAEAGDDGVGKDSGETDGDGSSNGDGEETDAGDDAKTVGLNSKNADSELGSGAGKMRPEETITDEELADKLISKTLRSMEKNVEQQFSGDGSPVAQPVSDKARKGCIRKLTLGNANTFGAYDEFAKDNSAAVNALVKEFTMKRKAAQYKMAKVVKTGSLNMSRLHEYRYNDEIFLRGMKLPTGKSHGMVMLIDSSGSMSSVIHKVIRQAIILAMFCRKANIPFAVYSFTSGGAFSPSRSLSDDKAIATLDMRSVNVLELLSSEMSKNEFKAACNHLIGARMSMGGTPMFEALIALQPAVKELKIRHNLDKMNMVVLTDGAPQWMSQYSATGRRERADRVMLDKRTMLCVDSNTDFRNAISKFTKGIYDWYRKSGAVDTVTHFFLAERSQAMMMGLEWKADAEPMVEDDVDGYDRRFNIPVKSASLNAFTEELEFDPTATKGRIINAFKKHAGSKRGTRIIVNKFIDLIA